jgi:hypothetical protein
VLDGTVKENIIMGKIFEEEWYEMVVVACSLLIDFDQLRDGDMTIVGGELSFLKQIVYLSGFLCSLFSTCT